MGSGLTGVFDSGLGGLTVAGRILSELPELPLLYFGDTAHCPYGNRTADEVCALIDSIVAYLVGEGVEAVVMACNTSSALAYARVTSWCPVPVIGIIEPAARAAGALTRNGKIGLIANPLTARSGAYERALAPAVVELRRPEPREFEPRIFPVGCPKLVPLVEAGQVNTPEAREALEEYLGPLREEGVDTLILGCTHYPFFCPLIRELMSDVTIVDPAEYALEELRKLGLKGVESPVHRFEVSGNPAEFEKTGTRLLGRRLSGVRQVELVSRRASAAS
ncbi:MAG: glutamate racemase [Candidatus Xenobia bacterium]